MHGSMKSNNENDTRIPSSPPVWSFSSSTFDRLSKSSAWVSMAIGSRLIAFVGGWVEVDGVTSSFHAINSWLSWFCLGISVDEVVSFVLDDE